MRTFDLLVQVDARMLERGGRVNASAAMPRSGAQVGAGAIPWTSRVAAAMAYPKTLRLVGPR
jgi:hypothetical protein